MMCFPQPLAPLFHIWREEEAQILQIQFMIQHVIYKCKFFCGVIHLGFIYTTPFLTMTEEKVLTLHMTNILTTLLLLILLILKINYEKLKIK